MKEDTFSGRWTCYDGLTADQVGAKATANNAYLTDLETYDAGDQRLFSAVMMSNPGVAWWWYFGLTPDELGAKMAEHQAVPTRLITHGQGRNRRFGAVLQRREGQGYWWYYGLSADELGQKLAEHDACPQDILAYMEGGALRFAAILYPRDGAGYWWYFGLTHDDLAAKLRENGAAPFRIRAYDTPNGTRYVAILAPQTQAVWWFYGQDLANIKAEARKNCAYVSDLTTYVEGGRRLFTCILKQKPQLATALDDWTDLAKPPTYCADLLIVTSKALRRSLDDLVAHKRAIGLRTTVVTMPTIHQQGLGDDDAEKLKRVIWDAHHILGVRYVLLAGSAKDVPVRHRCVLQPWSETLPIAQTWNATDYYYGNLFDDDPDVFASWASAHPEPGVYNRQVWGTSAWAANPDSVAGRPVIAVGRIPAGQAAEMRSYAQKVIVHETAARAAAGSKCLAASKFYPGSAQSLDLIDAAGSGLPGQNQTLRLGMRFDEADPLPAGWQRVAGNDELFDAFHSKQWVFYVGHGADDCWDNHFATWQMAGQLQNAGNFPIVVAASCETARFSPNLPWDAVGTGYPYKDRAGVDHQFVNPGDTPGAINDVFHDPVERPVNLPVPAPYDYWAPPEGRASLVNGMLFCNNLAGAPTGAIGYIGETVGMDNGPSVEFGVAMMRNYAADPSLRLGDIWLRAQQDYFSAHLPAHIRYDHNFGHPRIFLSIIQLLGDPSLLMGSAG
jgi:Peptidase family C25